VSRSRRLPPAVAPQRLPAPSHLGRSRHALAVRKATVTDRLQRVRLRSD
jgi:hypothetical protein